MTDEINEILEGNKGILEKARLRLEHVMSEEMGSQLYEQTLDAYLTTLEKLLPYTTTAGLEKYADYLFSNDDSQ